MASISVGSVTVDVVPSTKTFARDLRRQLLPDASKVGADIGDSIGQGIKRGIGNPLTDPLADSTRTQSRKAPGQGEEVAGAFARGFRRRLDAAFKALPKAEIGADSSNADRTIAGLRGRLGALADKTVGVDVDATAALSELDGIRAELDRIGATATVDVRADVAEAAAQLAAVQAQVGSLDGRQVDVTLSRRSAASFSNGSRSASLMRAELVSLIAVGVAVAPAAIAAGAGFVSFAALAAPSIIKVVKAQGDMAAEWSGLDQRQRVAAVSVQSLTEEYKRLAVSVEPQVLSTLQAGLGVVRAAMVPLVPLTRSVTSELTTFANRTETALRAPAAHEFFAFLSQQAGPAVTQFGSTLFAGAHLAASLTTALSPLAFGTLRVATAVAELAADLFDAAPALAEMLTVAVALRSPIGGLGNFITNTGGRVRSFSAAAKGASLSTKALNLATAAGPNLYLAAGAALVFLAVKAATATTATDRLISSLRISTQATGNNLAGYRALEVQLGQRLSAAMQRSAARSTSTGYALNQTGNAAKTTSREVQALSSAWLVNHRQAANVTGGAKQLAGQFGITSDQARALATAAGVDLSAGISGTGRAAQQAQQKILQYRAAVEAARNPTAVVAQALRQAGNSALTMKDRVAALKTALDAFFTPSINVYNTITQLKRGFSELSTAAAKAKSNFSGNTAASIRLREAFAQQLITVGNLKTAVFEKTKNENLARAAAARHLPVLYALAGGNKGARAQVDALATSLGVATGRTNITRAAFIRTATQMGLSRDRAEVLWREFRKIPKQTDTTSNAHTKAALAAIAKLQAKASALDGTAIDLRARMDISDAISKLESLRRYSNQGGRPGGPGGRVAEGGIMRFARGGIVRMARGGAIEAHFAKAPTLLYGERETGGEAFIPLAASKRKRSTAILTQVADEFGMRLIPMADGGIVGSSGGGGGALLTDILSSFRDQTKPASKSEVDTAARARRRAVDQLRDAEAGLRRARKSDNSDRIAAAERRLRREREDLTAATSKLTSVQARYNIAKQAPTTQLSGALSARIKTNATFIKNLTALSDRGFGVFAQQLLSMGGVDAEKLAADAVKLSSAKIKALQSKISTAQTQQQTLQSLPALLAAREAAKTRQQRAAELAALGIVDARAAGYARGGLIGGRGGPRDDANLIRASRGEYMVNARSTAAHRPLLEAINARPMAAGGAVTAQASPGVQQASNAALGAGVQQTVALRDATTALNVAKTAAAAADIAGLVTLRQLTTGTGQVTTAVRTGTAATQISTTANRNATVADRAKAAQLARTAAATRAGTAATTAAGRSTDATRTKTIAMRAELGRAQGQLVRTGSAATALTGKYHGIPKAVKTAISVNARGQYTIKDLGSFAEGGPVYGPGTETSDSIPARLSRNEYVIPAASHRQYGTEMLDAIRERRFAKGGSVTTGGPVSFTGMPAQVKGGLNKQRDTSNKWTAEYVGKEIKKLLQGPLGVVRAARSQIGQGDVGGENRNKYNSAFAWQGAPWCYAAGTLIDTPDGLRPIEEIEPGTLVFTPSGGTAGTSALLTREKELFELTALGVPDTLVTEEHPYWAMRRTTHAKRKRRLNEPTWIKAGDLRRGDMIALPIPPEGDAPADLAMAYLFGAYLADGHRLHRDYGVQISDEASESERILAAFKNAGYDNVRVTENRTCLHFTVYDRDLYDACGRYGDLAEGKRIPGEVFLWARPAREALLEGYLAGDGCFSDGTGWHATTVSRRLAHGLGKLVRSLRITPAVSVAREAQTMTIEGREVATRRQYEIRWRPWPIERPQFFEADGYLWVPVRRVARTGRVEKVYDLTVPGEHAFIADGAAVHNCAAFVSWCIRAAKAQRMYPGYPTAAVAGYNSRMKHVRTGQPGDLGVYRGNGHINIIASGPRGGGYLTIGGNQGPKVNSYVRGGQSSILRPRGFAAGGPVDRKVFGERNFDPGDRNDPLLRLYRHLRPSQAVELGNVLNSLNYDDGGLLPAGKTLVDNGTGRPEPVLRPDQFDALVTGRAGREVRIGEGAHITIAKPTDVDTLMQRAEFLARSSDL